MLLVHCQSVERVIIPVSLPLGILQNLSAFCGFVFAGVRLSDLCFLYRIGLPCALRLCSNVQLCGQVVDLTSIDLSSLLSLRHLSLNHCALESLNPLFGTYVCVFVCAILSSTLPLSRQGLRALHRLESLSLAHNFLPVESLQKDCPLASLGALRRLDLSKNVLNAVPSAVLKLSK